MDKSMMRRIDTDPSKRVTIESTKSGSNKNSKNKTSTFTSSKKSKTSASRWILSPSINSDRGGDRDEYGAVEENAYGNATTPFE
jgi:hypothetical protein